GRVIRGVEDVLDGDGNAVQGPERVALLAVFVEPAGLGKRMVGVEMDERFDLAIKRFNALQAGAGIVLGRNPAAGDLRCRLACSQVDEFVGHSRAGAELLCLTHRRDSSAAKASSPATHT